MHSKNFRLLEDDAGRRFDRVIRRFLPELSLSLLYKSIRKGLIKLNGKKIRAGEKTRAGDILSIDERLLPVFSDEKAVAAKENEKSSSSLFKNRGRKLPFSIVFQNEHVLVVNKPSGMAVCGGVKSLEKSVASYLEGTKKTKSLSFSFGLSNRIDRSTSGLVIFSLSLKAAHFFRLALSEQKIKKEYLAISVGRGIKSALYEMFLGKDENEGAFRKVKIVSGGKKAITRLTVIEEAADFSLVKAELLTGRKHQIRVLFSHLSHPIVGDTAYGAPFYKKKDFIALHSWRLSFSENDLALPSSIEAPVPKDFLDFLSKTSFSFRS